LELDVSVALSVVVPVSRFVAGDISVIVKGIVFVARIGNGVVDVSLSSQDVRPCDEVVIAEVV